MRTRHPVLLLLQGALPPVFSSKFETDTLGPTIIALFCIPLFQGQWDPFGSDSHPAVLNYLCTVYFGMWSGDSVQKFVFSFYHVGYGAQAQVLGFGGKSYSLTHCAILTLYACFLSCDSVGFLSNGNMTLHTPLSWRLAV